MPRWQRSRTRSRRVPDVRPGVRLALDWGKARIGVAACDASAILAYPVETVPAGEPYARLAELVTEYAPIEVVIGYPVNLAGQDGPAARDVWEAAKGLARRITPTPIRLVDERMSTVSASRRLGDAGRTTRQQRDVIDQAAAVEILNQALDQERRTGAPAGTTLEDAR